MIPPGTAAAGRDGLFGGLDVSRTFEQTKGTYAVALSFAGFDGSGNIAS